MKQNDKDLLLKDLCARLQYGVKLSYRCNHIHILKGIHKSGLIVINDVATNVIITTDVENTKPYLFPLSSMTEEQKQEYTYIVNYISSDDTENWKEGEFIYVEQFSQLMYFYHINHLDYRGLITMGLAIDATGLNIY